MRGLDLRARALRERLLLALAGPTLVSVAGCSGADATPQTGEVSVPTSSAQVAVLTAAPSASGPVELPPKDPADRAWAPQENSVCMPKDLTQGGADQACGSPGGWVHRSKWSCGPHCLWSQSAELTAKERAAGHPDACCFVGHDMRPPVRGRPLVGERGPIVATPCPVDERAPEPAATPSRGALSVGRAYLEMAALEHASVAELARVSLSLLALGAPASLISWAHRAAIDELRHADLALTLAERALGRRHEVAPLDVGASRPLPRSRVELFEQTLHDGCVGETLAALEVGVASDAADEADVRRALGGVAADEGEHAALSYAIARWLVDTASSHERAVMRALIAHTLEQLGSSAASLPDDEQDDDALPTGAGHLSSAERRRAYREGAALVVRPALEALLAA